MHLWILLIIAVNGLSTMVMGMTVDTQEIIPHLRAKKKMISTGRAVARILALDLQNMTEAAR